MSQDVVLVHGGFHGGWCWRPVAEPLRRLGWTVHAPSLTGCGDRAHLLSSQVTQDDRIQDVVGLIEAEELTNVLLCAHSAGGMIATGVAEQIPDRITHIVYLDAILPNPGESLLDVIGNGEGVVDLFQNQAAGAGDGWRIPSSVFTAEMFGVIDPDSQEWVTRRLTDDSLRVWEEPLHFGAGFAAVARKTFVRAEQFTLGFTTRIYERLARDPAWRTISWDIGHDVMIIDPYRVVKLLTAAAVPD
jgi:pimeloyl-ACP methyl ester carboxylesterase